MQDIGLLCQKYLDLPDKRVGIRVCGTELKYQGTNSIVFSDGETVIKIMTTGKPGDAEREYQRLCQFQSLGGEQFVLPRPFAHGSSPEEFVIMSDIGPSFSQQNPSIAEYLEAAKALGEFAGKIWNLNHSVYTDIHPRNFTTAPDGKIGIVDLGCVVQNEMPEAMFWTPLGIRAELCPAIASAFTQETGRDIDVELVKSLALEKLAQPITKGHRNTVQRNLDNWKKLTVSRPQGSTAYSKDAIAAHP